MQPMQQLRHHPKPRLVKDISQQESGQGQWLLDLYNFFGFYHPNHPQTL